MKPGFLFSLKCDAVCVALSHFRNVLLFLLLFTSSRVLAFGQERPAAASGSAFAGAELYTNVKEGGRATVYLRKFYKCGMADTRETEHLSVQRDGSMRRDDLLLKKVNNSGEDKNAPMAPAGSGGCVEVVAYSAEIDLENTPLDYCISWGYSFLNHRFTNLSDAFSGLTLTLKINGTQEQNTASLINTSEFPFALKNNVNSVSQVKPADAEGDEVSVSLGMAQSLNSIAAFSSSSMQGEESVMPEGSVLPDRYPYRPAEFRAGYSKSNPLGAKIFALDEKTGELKHHVNEPGNYVMAIDVTEMRAGKVISQHPCVFIIDVQ